MREVPKTRTISKDVFMEGIGLHSGAQTSLRISPLEERGLFFSLEGRRYPLEEALFKGDGRGSEIFFPSGSIKTVEHLLAAIGGLSLQNLLIEIDGGEVPVMDGSALSFCKAFIESGIVTRDVPSEPIYVDKPIYVDDHKGEKTIAILPSDKFCITYVIDYENPLIGSQFFSCTVDPEVFCEDIAPCRTFALMEEVNFLRSRGLAMGGSLENCIVIDGHEVLAHNGLRFKDEFVRHKVLDLIGDLTLFGRPLIGHVIALKAGHSMHQQLVRSLKEEYRRFF